MSATIGHSAGEIHRRRCSTPHVIGAASIPRGIFRTSLASCRPMPIAGSTLSSIPDARRCRPRPPSVGHMDGGRSSLADITQNARRGRSATAISPIALEAVRRIDKLFEIERDIYGLSAEERLQIRRERSAPLLTDLEAWLRAESTRLSRSSNVIKPINYLLNRWESFARLVHDGRICMTNNAAERALRSFALGRKAWLFAGSDRGAERAAVMAHASHDGASQRHRPESLACRRLRAHRRHAAEPPARVAALELDASCVEVLRPGGVAMHVNKAHAVFTVARVVKDLGEDEDWLWDVANGMDTEDGVIGVYGTGDDQVMAFTDFGIENLTELIRIHKDDPELLKRWDR